MGFYENHILPAIMDVALVGLKEDRQDLISQASGNILEIGMGNGVNLPFYTNSAKQIVGLEPCEAVVCKAKRKLRGLADEGALQVGENDYKFIVGGAEQLQFESDSFDTIIASLVFCSIPDAASAAREAFRVLKPGGKLLFFEHVQSPDQWTCRIQTFVNPLWKVFACGCSVQDNHKVS
jgi:ubiquinone/menaquinone biosynthesis C-methylase UbiE